MAMQLSGKLTLLVYQGTKIVHILREGCTFHRLCIEHEDGSIVLDLDADAARKLYKGVRELCRAIDSMPARKPAPILDEEEEVDLHKPPV